MDVKKLMAGIAVIIDDEVNDGQANISHILHQIDENNFPSLRYSLPPTQEIVQNFKDISFVVLDWQFKSPVIAEGISEGVVGPSLFEDGDLAIEFIKELKKVCFTPIFIFSNEEREDIIDKLVEHDLYIRGSHNNIFVGSKTEVEESLLNKIEEWLRITPSVYALKEWDLSFNKARKDLFWNFYEIHPDWPKILWATYGDDGVNKSMELGETISKNIHARIEPFDFEDAILNSSGTVPKEDIRAVMEGERFIKKRFLPDNMIHTGDLFKVGTKYYLNIRPNCDCIARSCTLDEVELYLLEGKKVPINNQAQIDKVYNSDYGILLENDSCSCLFPIDGGNLIRFNFNKMIQGKWIDYKGSREGKVVSPYVVKVQQKYSAYLQRQGLNRIPKESLIV